MIEALADAAQRTVSRETFDQLRTYADFLEYENERQNLVSRGTLSDLWERHILDSAQLVRYETNPGATWVDIGSGAGLPGIVLACLVQGPVTLVEPRRLRADFLQRVIAEIGLNATVIQRNAQAVSGAFDMITGRAVAPLGRFFEMCDHLSTKKSRWVLPKGRTAESELAQARRAWQGVFHVEPSVTDADSKIIVATEVEARDR